MAKFANRSPRPARGPAATAAPARTHEGGRGYAKDAKTALWTLAVTNMVSETTFYESGGERDKRFVDLITEVTKADPAWVAGFVSWLRNEANMRSASVMVACEYVAAGGPNGRAVIASACSRADEPGEVIGYWHAIHGRRLPMAVKRGVADAAGRLYNERSLLKYDTNSRAIRFGDVIELAHPKPKDQAQSDLFRHAIDRRHNRPGPVTGLPLLQAAYSLDSTAPDARRALLNTRGPAALADAGYTWERLSGWLPGGMDAEAWEAIIPSMGLMAIVRNLRNFEQAKISDATIDAITARLMDPDEVRRSRQLPFRFYSAWKATGSLTWGRPLQRALDHSLANVPRLPGRTLVLVDTSGSMTYSTISGNSQIRPVDVAAVFGASIAASADSADLAIFGDHSKTIELPPSVLRAVERIDGLVGSVGHGTQIWRSALAQYRNHDRIIVLTDMQEHPARAYGVSALPDVPIYVWDLQGHKTANVDLNTPKRYLFGGYSDSAFKIMQMIEQGFDAGWPWES